MDRPTVDEKFAPAWQNPEAAEFDFGRGFGRGIHDL
jgi:hypothetical protein